MFLKTLNFDTDRQCETIATYVKVISFIPKPSWYMASKITTQSNIL